GVGLTLWNELPRADAIVAAVSHREYLEMPFEKMAEKLNPMGLFVDIKSTYSVEEIVAAGYKVWRL
ncbi:MAG TPA: nucleotide sugar dehydrogenase, partial [Rhodocyclaceae bacterium]|nr:nucleotide sugar dehydrogenase [Rhodocyclaceae bacterium]